MTPLRIRATIRTQISIPRAPIALDALLMAKVAEREGWDPPATPQDARRDIDIPIEKEPGGRFHLASCAVYVPERFDSRFVNRRFDISVAQDLGEPRLRTIRINGGACKTYRIPMETMHVAGDTLVWFCVGDAEPIRDLLRLCTSLGKRRAVGLGRVSSWEVDPIEPWDGFPCVFKGRALRSLPKDWPGLVNPRIANAVLSPPYTDRLREEPLAVPDWMTEARQPRQVAA